VFEKNALAADATGFHTGYGGWLNLALGSGVRDFIVVGNCTDLCVYQAAMQLKMRFNGAGWYTRSVIVPADCVQTYDALGHPGDQMHDVFLRHMALNGIEVVTSIY
jgi:hypothetical protein